MDEWGEWTDEEIERYKQEFMKKRMEYYQRMAEEFNKHYVMSYFTVGGFQFHLALSKS